MKTLFAAAAALGIGIGAAQAGTLPAGDATNSNGTSLYSTTQTEVYAPGTEAYRGTPPGQMTSGPVHHGFAGETYVYPWVNANSIGGGSQG